MKRIKQTQNIGNSIEQMTRFPLQIIGKKTGGELLSIKRRLRDINQMQYVNAFRNIIQKTNLKDIFKTLGISEYRWSIKY